MTDKTMTFRIGDDHEDVMKETLTEVFDALQEKGYNPINQIVGYILTDDHSTNTPPRHPLPADKRKHRTR